MESSRPLSNQSAISYADVLRGNKVFARKSRRAADTEAEKVPISKDVSTPKAVQKTVQEKVQKNKGFKSAQKGSKSGSKRSREGASQAMQQANSSRIKLSQAGNCSAMERLTVSHFSYAEVVKGKISAMALQFRDGEVANKTEIVPFTFSYLSTCELPPNPPFYFEFKPPEDSISSSQKRADGVAACQNNLERMKDWADEPTLRFAGHITANQPRQPAFCSADSGLTYTTYASPYGDFVTESFPRKSPADKSGMRVIYLAHHDQPRDGKRQVYKEPSCCLSMDTLFSSLHLSSSQSYRTPPSPFSVTTIRDLPNDPIVETTMQYTIIDGYGRHSFARERDVRQARLIHCHALRLIELSGIHSCNMTGHCN